MTSDSTPGAPRYFETVDLLRGFAAISVLVYHVIECGNWQDFPEQYGLIWFKWGWMGVDIFFVISGFAITHSALNLRERCTGNGVSVIRTFMQRRLLRIVPLHYLSIAIFVLAFGLSTQADFFENLVAHLFFVHNLFPDFHRAINAPNWSLGVEMQFYLVLILIIPLVSARNVIYYVCGAFIISFIWRAIWYFAVDHAHPTFPDALFIAATQLPGMLDFFGVGMALAFFTRSRLFDALANSVRYRLTLFFTICLASIPVVWIYVVTYGFYWQTFYMVIFFRSCLAVIFGSLLLLACSFQPGAMARKALMPFMYLGTISYGIYLFHWPVLKLAERLALSNSARLLIVLLVSIALAAVSWHFYERRFLMRKHY